MRHLLLVMLEKVDTLKLQGPTS